MVYFKRIYSQYVYSLVFLCFSFSEGTERDFSLELVEMQVSEGLHLNSAICIPPQHPESRAVYIDELIDLALDQDPCLTVT